jgi:hypothetical protein
MFPTIGYAPSHTFRSNANRADSESRFGNFLSREFLWKMRLASRENIIASLTSLARREKCDTLWSLLVLQFARLAICKFKSRISRQNRRIKVIFETSSCNESENQVGSICEKTRVWKSRETITLREPQFCFKLCCQNCVRPKILARFLQDSRVKISIDSRKSCYKILFARLVRSECCYEICLRDLRDESLTTKFLSAWLARSESRY